METFPKSVDEGIASIKNAGYLALAGSIASKLRINLDDAQDWLRAITGGDEDWITWPDEQDKRKVTPRLQLKQKFPAHPVMTMNKRRKRPRRSSRKAGRWLKNKIKRICRATMQRVTKPLLWAKDGDIYVRQAPATDGNTRLIFQIDALDAVDREHIYDNIVKTYLQDLSDTTFPTDITGGAALAAPFFKFNVTGIKVRIMMHNVYNHPFKLHMYWIRYLQGSANDIETFCNTHLSRKMQAASEPLTKRFNVWPTDTPGFRQNFRVLSRKTVIFQPGQTQEFNLNQPFWSYNSNTADTNPFQQNNTYPSGTTTLFVMAEGPPRHEHKTAEAEAEIGNVVNWIECTLHKRAKVSIDMNNFRDFGAVSDVRTNVDEWQEINDTTEKADAEG